MIKKIVLLFIVGLFFSSCNDINYDSETRLVIEGRLVNENGESMSNRYIDIAVYNELGYGAYATDVISSGTTDVNGNFRYIIPAPKDFSHYMSIRINSVSNSYQHKEYALIQRKDFTNYRFNVGTATLYPTQSIATLNVITQQVNPQNELVYLNIDGLRSDETIFINPLQPDYELFENYFSVIKNQTVRLHYTIMDRSNPNNPESTDYETPIVIDNEQQINYTLNY
jgi:hypothetical protein